MDTQPPATMHSHSPVLPSYRVDGSVAVVTGGSRGIGLGSARALAEAGANVVLLARSESELESAATTVARATYVVCDVTDPAQVKATIGSLERIDILVNSAAATSPSRSSR